MRNLIANVFILLGFIVSCENDANDNQLNVDPICMLVQPEDGAEIIQGEQVTVVVKATDENDDITRVQFFINNELLKTETRFPYTYTWITGDVQPGEHRIKAIAFDENGGRAEDEIAIHIQSKDTDGVISDADGNIYKTIIIGNQEWIKSNLRTTVFNDGSKISNITENRKWSEVSSPAFTWYGNHYNNFGITYGALYNWFAVNSGMLCPEGWKVPDDYDWSVLINYLGGADVAGGKLKEQGTDHWTKSNAGVSNESGFTALPGGYRYHDGTFHYLGGYGIWWSSTASGEDGAWSRLLENQSNEIRRYNYEKTFGLSVRCMRPAQ